MQTRSITQLQRLQFAFQIQAASIACSIIEIRVYTAKEALAHADSLIKEAGFIVEGDEHDDAGTHWREEEANDILHVQRHLRLKLVDRGDMSAEEYDMWCAENKIEP